MTKSERQERKQKIRERYKGTDTSRIKVLHPMSFRRIIILSISRRNQVGSSLEFMLTRASVVLLLSTERECRS